MGFFTSSAPSGSTADLVAAEFAKPNKHFCRKGNFKAGKNTLDLSCGISLEINFADPEGLLETAYADLRQTVRDHELAENGKVPFVVEFDPELDQEEAMLGIGDEKVQLSAGGTEGIRRGIYHFCRLLDSAYGPFIEKKKHHLKYVIKNRISRSFYSPTHRPPNDIDELLSEDVDYYPEPYLSTLASEGINVLWLTVQLAEVSWSSIRKPDEKMELRLKKLRETVDRCRRYGIRIFVFFIEPAGFVGESELLKEHPELEGVDWGYNMKCFCPTSQTAYDHLYQQMFNLFKSVPRLGGVINIPCGEALCSCFFGGSYPYKCPRCHDLERWRVLNNSIEPMFKGMRDAAPDAEYVCWFYHSHPEFDYAWVRECIEHLPEDMIFLYNFESGIKVKQQGREIAGGDYWQAMPGASERFKDIARWGTENGTRIGAKMQISNDHAMATVPVVPVPETLYKKYRIIRENKIDTVMYSWYFGCCPGIMNRAALELSREKIAPTAEKFLDELARMEFGKDHGAVKQSWKYFSRAYSLYPVNRGLQYKGPFNSGINWTLYPEAALKELTEAWQSFGDSGDCIGGCLNKYPLSEVVDQAGKMSRLWEKGVGLIRGLVKKYPVGSDQRKQLIRAIAIGINFKNASLIFEFYQKRLEFYNGNRRALDKMERLFAESMELTGEMIKLCREDIFIGYHSEAEIHKYSAELLKKRRRKMLKVLKETFPKLRRSKTAPGFPAGTYLKSVKPGDPEIRCDNFAFKVDKKDDELVFTVFSDPAAVSENLMSEKISIQISDPLGTIFPQVCSFDRNGLKFNSEKFQVEHIERNGAWGAVVRIPISQYEGKMLSFDILMQRMVSEKLCINSWSDPDAGVDRPYSDTVLRNKMGLIILEP